MNTEIMLKMFLPLNEKKEEKSLEGSRTYLVCNILQCKKKRGGL